MANRSNGSNGKYGTSTGGSRSSSSRPDPIGDKIRELQSYADVEDDDTTVTGNHNIVAMPGSHVHVHSDPDLESEIPLSRVPKWAKVTAGVVSALIGVGSVIKAIWEATK